MTRFSLLATCIFSMILLACVSEELPDEKATSSGEETPSVEVGAIGAADSGNSPYQGEIAWDVLEEASLTQSLPYHLWSFEGREGDGIFIDLASREGDDMFAILYIQNDDGTFAYVTHNDDCGSYTLNSCIETTLPADGQYLIAASTYDYIIWGIRSAATYHLTLVCRNDSGTCGADEAQLCGSRGLPPCPEGQFCNWPDDTCGADDRPGVCEPRPEPISCTRYVADEVCGCDGQTYVTPCFANLNGADIAYYGACEPSGQGVGETCGGIASLQCAEGLVCDYSANVPSEGTMSCYPDMGGVCVEPVEIFCTMEYNPVCGCDGRTYGNDCTRRAAYVALDHRGPCESGGGDDGAGVGETCGGIAGLLCAEGLVCDYSGVEGCHTDMAGVCSEQIEILCTMEYDPVCGCDGRTYGNDCTRHAAHAALDHRGACEE